MDIGIKALYKLNLKACDDGVLLKKNLLVIICGPILIKNKMFRRLESVSFR
jgi:hypothetical protein